MVMLRQCPKRW